jgi:hypothetical protein
VVSECWDINGGDLLSYRVQHTGESESTVVRQLVVCLECGVRQTLAVRRSEAVQLFVSCISCGTRMYLERPIGRVQSVTLASPS